MFSFVNISLFFKHLQDINNAKQISKKHIWKKQSQYYLHPYDLLLEYLSLFFIKGGMKVHVLEQGGVCNSAPNGPNDVKICLQGAFVGYYCVLVKSRSCDLYRGQTCSGLQMWLTSIEVMWPWLDQNSIVTHKSPLQANFQVICSIWGWVTDTPLSKNMDT